MLNFIGNARIIFSLKDLPKIGAKHKNLNARVFSIEAYQDDEHENFIFYRVLYGEYFNKKNMARFDIEIDCFSFLYAINKKDIFRR